MTTRARDTIANRLPAAAAAASLTLLLAGCATGPQPAARTGDRAADAPATAHAVRWRRQGHSTRAGNAYFRTTTRTTEGSVTVEGHTIRYRAVAGLLVVHPAGWNDAQPRAGGQPPGSPAHGKGHQTVPNEASMFYVAYFKEGARPAHRPITFLYNGGPGSSSVWLHMGAFGPRRVVTADHTHTPPAPYRLVDNHYSLLDATDLVFVDAPGTGFGRLLA